MNRRRILAVGGTTLFGGCLTRAGLDASGPKSTETFGLDEVQRRMSLANVDEVREKYAVGIDAELSEETVTAAHTARLRVTVANEGEKRKLSAGEGMCNPFNREKGKSENPGLWLHEPEDTEWIERKGDRWTRDRSPNEQRMFPNYGCLPREYEEGESVTTEYAVWDDYRVVGYMGPGTYRFEEQIRIYAPKYDDWKDTLGEFRWGFDLRVEDE